MSKEKKIKTYVITVSVNFPKKKKEKLKLTNFKKKILSGEKKHTLRCNYEYWKKRIDQVNAGKAILSVRYWSDLPYKSKQIEIKQFKKGEIDYQSTIVTSNADVVLIVTDGMLSNRSLNDKEISTLAKNDGLTLPEFKNWFKKGALNGIIIHFTNDFKY
jgi:hypothetical protein